MSEQPNPAPGDVMVTSENGSYALSVVPDRHQLTLARLDDAIRIATTWAKARSVTAWHLKDGSSVRLTG